MRKKSPEGLLSDGFLALMLRIVGGELEAPQVTLVSLFAVRLVLLGDESGLVGRHLHQVLGTGCHGACDDAEAVTSCHFGRPNGSGTLHFAPQIQSITFVTGGSRYAVCCQKHFGARVLAALARLCQCAGYAVYSGGESYTCHIS